MNIFIQRAASYMGVSLRDKLSKTDEKRLRAKAKKMKTSDKKAKRKGNKIETILQNWI